MLRQRSDEAACSPSGSPMMVRVLAHATEPRRLFDEPIYLLRDWRTYWEVVSWAGAFTLVSAAFGRSLAQPLETAIIFSPAALASRVHQFRRRDGDAQEGAFPATRPRTMLPFCA